jgi:hypothetical protein
MQSLLRRLLYGLDFLIHASHDCGAFNTEDFSRGWAISQNSLGTICRVQSGPLVGT